MNYQQGKLRCFKLVQTEFKNLKLKTKKTKPWTTQIFLFSTFKALQFHLYIGPCLTWFALLSFLLWTGAAPLQRQAFITVTTCIGALRFCLPGHFARGIKWGQNTPLKNQLRNTMPAIICHKCHNISCCNFISKIRKNFVLILIFWRLLKAQKSSFCKEKVQTRKLLLFFLAEIASLCVAAWLWGQKQQGPKCGNQLYPQACQSGGPGGQTFWKRGRGTSCLSINNLKNKICLKSWKHGN